MSAAPSRAQGKPKQKGRKDKKEHASKEDMQPSAKVLGCSKCRGRPTGCQACSATALGCTKCRFKEGGCGLCKRKASLAQQAAEQRASDSQPPEEDVPETVPVPLAELEQGHDPVLVMNATAAEQAQASTAVQVHPIWHIHASAPISMICSFTFTVWVWRPYLQLYSMLLCRCWAVRKKQASYLSMQPKNESPTAACR